MVQEVVLPVVPKPAPPSWNPPEIPSPRGRKGLLRDPGGRPKWFVVLGQGIGAAWNSIMSFIAPAGFPTPVPQKTYPRLDVGSIGWSADAWHKDACGPRSNAIVAHGRVYRFPRGHRDHCLPELDRSAPPFRSCSPIIRRASPSNCLLPLLVYRLISKEGESLHASLTRDDVKEKPVHRILYVLLTFDFQRMEGSLFVRLGRLIDRFYGLFRLWDGGGAVVKE